MNANPNIFEINKQINKSFFAQLGAEKG